MSDKATHWMDDRKLVITERQRNEASSDYKAAYNVPCVKVRGVVKPIHTCPHCNGTGEEPGFEYDSCYVCMGSGGAITKGGSNA